MAGQKLAQQMLNRRIKVAGADAPPDTPRIEIRHELDEAWLWLLEAHGAALDGADGFVGGGLLVGGEGVDVFEDVDGFVDGEGGAHFGEHVVLGEAWGDRVRLGRGVLCVG